MGLRGLIGRLASRNDLAATLVRGSAGSAVVKVVYVMVQAATVVLLARVLGPEDLGVYAFTIALVQVFVVVAQFGFPTFLVRSVAVAIAEKDLPRTRAHVIGANRIVLAIALLLAAGIAAWQLLADGSLPATSKSALVAGLPLIPLMALTATACAAIRGWGHVMAAQLPSEIVRPVTLLILLLLAQATDAQLTPALAIMAHTCAVAIAYAMSLLVLRNVLSSNGVPPARSSTGAAWLLRSSLPFLLISGAQMLSYQVDVLMLGLLTNEETVGHYRITVLVASGLAVALYAISVTIAPHIARLHALGDWASLQRVLVTSHRAGVAVLLPLGLTVAWFSAPIITIAFGPDYLPGSTALTILALAHIPYAAVGFSGTALTMLGSAKTAAALTGLMLPLNLLLNAVLIPTLGLNGAALATGFSLVATNVIGLVWMRTSFKRNFSAFARLP